MLQAVLRQDEDLPCVHGNCLSNLDPIHVMLIHCPYF